MPNEEPSFEQSLARLQQLVDSLEDGQLPLGQSLAAYEEGIKHLKICHAALTETERKIEILSGFNAAGEPITKPFDDTATETDENVARRSRKSAGDVPRARSVREPTPEDRDVDGPRELF
jgi:exodeoxyribonuclease VII small subunit